MSAPGGGQDWVAEAEELDREDDEAERTLAGRPWALFPPGLAHAAGIDSREGWAEFEAECGAGGTRAYDHRRGRWHTTPTTEPVLRRFTTDEYYRKKGARPEGSGARGSLRAERTRGAGSVAAAGRK